MRVRLSAAALLSALLLVLVQQTIIAQDAPAEDTPPATYSDCQELETLMLAGQTPYDYTFGGGKLTFGPDAPLTGSLGAEQWADYYVFRKYPGPATLTITVEQSDPTLEIALLRRERPFSNEEGTVTYRPSKNADGTLAVLSFSLGEDETRPETFEGLPPGDVYTLVVRRPHVTDTDNVGDYRISAQLNDPALIAPLGEVQRFRDQDLPENRLNTVNVVPVTGLQRVRFNTGAEAFIHTESARTITDLVNEREVIFDDRPAGPQLTERATAHYIGGGVGARWQGAEGPLLLYIETLDYSRQLQDLLQSGLTGYLDTRYRNLASLYIMDGCFGFELRSTDGEGTTFIAELNPDYTARGFGVDGPNTVTNGCPAVDFDLVFAAENAEEEVIPHNLCLSWGGIEPGSVVRFDENSSTLTAQLVGEREIAIQSDFIRQLRRLSDDDFDTRGTFYGDRFNLNGDRIGSYSPRNETDDAINQPLAAIFDDPDGESVNVTLDWINMVGFRYEAPQSPEDEALCTPETLPNEPVNVDDEPVERRCAVFTFSEDDDIRERTVRPASGLDTLSALDDVIHMVYADTSERLLLPDNETYIELVTPADEEPTFKGAEYDPNARPGQPGYAPRLANNTGGECYPFPTLHPEANCAPNGHVNPANGNLWYSITDHRAAGYKFDLALTRSYNSANYAIDGPFGRGWSTDFLLDYNIGYDEDRAARTVTPASTNDYRTGLNLVWVPRGLVLYTAPSGSQHVFAREQTDTGADVFRSLTMPGWQLYRPNLREGWQMFQDDGYRLWFDRAGRLIQYGYPDENRLVNFRYNATLEDRIDGPAGYGQSRAITISDDFSQRRIELYYDDNHRIYRSTLRDIEFQPDTEAACEISDNCMETLYRYDEAGHLIQVIYPNRQEARYTYAPPAEGQTVETPRRMIGHNDPRAPIAPEMTYAYDAEGRVTLVQIPALALDWRRIAYTDAGTEITNELGAVRTYTFTGRDTSGWREPETPYRLASITHTSGETEFETSYNWTPAGARRTEGTAQRNFFVITEVRPSTARSLRYEYTGDVRLSRIQDGNIFRYQTQDIPLRNGGTLQTELLDDGAEAGYFYNPNESLPYRYNRRDGVILIFDRYSDNDRENWIRIINEYRAAPDFGFAGLHFYDYNEVGLVTEYQTAPDFGIDSHRIQYFYDGLGQLFGIIDGELGTYEIENAVQACDRQPVCREITITDPFDGVTIYRYNGREQLIEQVLQEGNTGPILRQMRYTYDALGRLISEQVRYRTDRECGVRDPGDNCFLTTAYRYEVGMGERRIIETDAEGHETVQTYDAFGRLTRVQAAGQPEKAYTYNTANAGTTVTQTTTYPEGTHTVTLTTDQQGRLSSYLYPLAGPADAAVNLEWRTAYQGGFNRLIQLNFGARAVDVAPYIRYDWGWENGWLPTSMLTDMNPNDNRPDINLQFIDDNWGQLGLWKNEIQPPNAAQLFPGEFHNVQVTTCFDPGAGTRVIYHRRAGADALPADCDLVDDGVDAIYHYDYHGRVLKIVDEFGTRDFNYAESTVEPYRWRVTMTATDPDGNNAITWVMIYNLAGELTSWTDDAGVTRTYTYDTAGRLREVTTGDETDEATVTFTYNRIGQLTREINGLGQGQEYTYNEDGSLRTISNLTTCLFNGYNIDAGRLRTVAVFDGQRGPDGGCLGSANVLSQYDLLYQDATNPDTLTGLRTPGGREYRISWAYEGNQYQLTVTDPNGHPTRYRFNGMGQLIEAEDAEANVFTWAYGPSGTLRQYVPPPIPGDDGNPQAVVYGIERFPMFDTENLLQLTAAVGNRASWRTALQRTPSGLAEQWQNQGTLQFDYDTLGRLAALTLINQLGDPSYEWSLARVPRQEDMRLSFTSRGDTVYEYTLAYDPLGRLESLEAADGTRTEYQYISPREIGGRTGGVEIERSDGRTEIYRRDGETITYSGPGIVEIERYDRLGNLLETETVTCEAGANPGCPAIAEGVVTTFTRDDAGNITTIAYSDGTSENTTYDLSNNPTAHTDREGRTTTYVYNRANQLIAATPPNGAYLQYFYTGEQLAAICRANPAEPWEDLAACQREDAVIEQYTYDALGRRTAIVRATYDDPAGDDNRPYELGNVPGQPGNITGNSLPTRLERRFGLFGGVAAANNGERFVYSEDGLNLLLERIVGDQRYRYTYEPVPYLDMHGMDAVVRVTGIEATGPLNDSTLMQYNAQGQVANVIVGGQVFDYTYDATGRYTITPATAPELAVDFDAGQTEMPVPRSIREAAADYTSSVTADPVSGHTTLETRSYFTGDTISITNHYRRISSGTILNEGNLDVRLPLLAQTILTGPEQDAAEDPITIPVTTDNGDVRALRTEGTGDILRHRHRLFYDYDAAGNLTEITYYGPLSRERVDTRAEVVRLVPVVCSRYIYDDANRLIEAQNGAGETLSRYTYDVHNRLVGMNDARFYYLEDSRIPAYASVVGGPLQAIDPLAVPVGYVFDEQGRLIPQNNAAPVIGDGDNGDPASACRVGQATPRAEFIPGAALFDGMVLDAQTGLGFIDGRAYLPEIGRFLQPDPLGADANGFTYQYDGTPEREPLPSIERERDIMAGLEALQLADSLNVQPPTVTDVLDRHLPRLERQPLSLVRALDGPAFALEASLQQRLAFPNWLTQAYNRPGPTINAENGLITWEPLAMPGQHRRDWSPRYDISSDFWQREASIGTPIVPPASVVPGLLDMRTPGYQPPRTITPQVWQAAGFRLDEAITAPGSPLGAAPDNIEDWLLGNWMQPQVNLDIAAATERLSRQYQQGSRAWVGESLTHALPDLPTIIEQEP